jgi:hypothetical protein
VSDHDPGDVDNDAPDHDQDDADLEVNEDEGRAALTRLFAADGPPDLDDELFAGPLYWPGVPATDIAEAFTALRNWVETLLGRYEHLDHRTIPPCWYLHPGHIEALQALRDHERGTFNDSSPAQAATNWQRELQFIEMRLREWTAYYGCDQTNHKTPPRRPRPVDEDEWSEMLEQEQVRRRKREVAAADPDRPSEE